MMRVDHAGRREPGAAHRATARVRTVLRGRAPAAAPRPVPGHRERGGGGGRDAGGLLEGVGEAGCRETSMGDLGTRLERVADRVPRTDDAFERLARRRGVRHRNRRITAALMAVAVAAGGTVAVFSAFERGSPEGPGPSGTGGE